MGLGACFMEGPRRGKFPLFSHWCFSPDSRIPQVHICWEDRRSRRWPTYGHRKGSRLQGMGQEPGGAGPSNGYQGNTMTCQLAHEGAATGLGHQGRVRAQPQGTGTMQSWECDHFQSKSMGAVRTADIGSRDAGAMARQMGS